MLKRNSDGNCASNRKSSVELERWDSALGRRNERNNQLSDAAREVRVDGAARDMVLRVLLLPFRDQFRTRCVE